MVYGYIAHLCCHLVLWHLLQDGISREFKYVCQTVLLATQTHRFQRCSRVFNGRTLFDMAGFIAYVWGHFVWTVECAHTFVLIWYSFTLRLRENFPAVIIALVLATAVTKTYTLCGKTKNAHIPKAYTETFLKCYTFSFLFLYMCCQRRIKPRHIFT